MSEKLSSYNTAVEATNALAPFYQEKAVAKIQEANARKSWVALLNAAGADPDPLTLEWFTAVSPYEAKTGITGALESGVENGLLTGNEEDGYLLAEKGRLVLAAFFDTAQELIAKAPALEEAEMGKLVAYLQRLSTAAKEASEPSAKPNLESSLWTLPGPDAPPVVLVDQYITDLRSFRDDAHITAWQQFGINGRTWETLTYLWNEEAHNAGELREKLERRAFSEEDYAGSLATLSNKGWAVQSGDNWQITEAGRAVRQAGEDETDRIFFAGWTVLNENEINELHDLLQRWLQKIKEETPAAEPA